VYRHIHRFDRSKKFSTWAYTIASNLAKNELRNRSRNPLVLFQTIKGNWDDEDRPLQFEDTTARPDDMYRKRHLRELVEDTVAKLPEHHREVGAWRGGQQGGERGCFRAAPFVLYANSTGVETDVIVELGMVSRVPFSVATISVKQP
jgi:DNA-directed RNA polymerase specialized sigma subunit